MKRQEFVAPEYVEGQAYNNRDLEAMADELLRDNSRSEICRKCGESGQPTGAVKPVTQDALDGAGNQLLLDFPEFTCANKHTWYKGEGKERGIGGDNPILFEEHFQQRKRREIYTSLGTPDPSIVAGIYNRTHPQGRKVNSKEQRQKNGASWYR